MSNLTDFTGLSGLPLKSALVSFLEDHAPLLTEHLLNETATYRYEGSKLWVRYRPAGHWSRDQILTNLALGKKQSPVAAEFLTILAEAEALRPLISTTTSSHKRGGWAESEPATVEVKAKGLSLWTQTWFTTKKGTSEGLELTFTAAEPDDKEASAEGWNT